MDGILLVNKPKGLTSRDVVNEASKILKTKKIGHTGTLDPMATGVLVLCVGKATKLVELLTNHDKTYEAEVILGIKTDTYDITGKVLQDEATNFNDNQIKDMINSFPKQYEQEVPIYSAVKIKGKKLYEYARNNETIDLPKRLVSIYNLKLLNVKNENNHTNFAFMADVSKGTYIRSLINDMALSLNTNGIMSALKRIKCGEFTLDMCYSLDEIKANKFKIITIEEALKDYHTIEVDDDLYKKISNGMKIENTYNKELIVFTKNQKVIAIYKTFDNFCKPYKMF